MRKSRLVFWGLMAIYLASFGCSASPNKVVGRWRWQDGEIAEYMPDGTAAWAAGGQNIAGTWKLEDNKFTIDLSGRKLMFQVKEMTEKSLKLERIPDGVICTAERMN